MNTFVAHAGIFHQICGELLFLGTDATGILCGPAGAKGGGLRFNLHNEVGQLCFGLLAGTAVYIFCASLRESAPSCTGFCIPAVENQLDINCFDHCCPIKSRLPDFSGRR